MIYLLKWLGITLIIVAVLAVIGGGFSYVTSEGKEKKVVKAKTKILVGGALIIPAVLMMILFKIIGLGTAPVLAEEVVVNEASVVEYRPSRSPEYFVCELTDNSGRIFELESRNKKIDAKNLCKNYIPGESYDFNYKYFDGRYYVIENKNNFI